MTKPPNHGIEVKPSRLQYLVAQGWPIRAFFAPWMASVPLLFGYVAFTLFYKIFDPLSGWWNLVQFALYVAISILLGLLVGFVFAFLVSPVLRLFLRLCGRTNGAPFQTGDWVRILAGNSRDQIGQVVDATNRDSVKVEIQPKPGNRRVETLCDFQLVRAGAP